MAVITARRSASLQSRSFTLRMQSFTLEGGGRGGGSQETSQPKLKPLEPQQRLPHYSTTRNW